MVLDIVLLLNLWVQNPNSSHDCSSVRINVLGSLATQLLATQLVAQKMLILWAKS